MCETILAIVAGYTLLIAVTICYMLHASDCPCLDCGDLSDTFADENDNNLGLAFE